MPARSLIAFAAALAALACPSNARADGSPSRFEVDLAAEGNYLGVPVGSQAGPGAGVSALVAVAPRWTAGLTLSTGAFINAESGGVAAGGLPTSSVVAGLTRADLEGRYHAVLTRFFDVWGGADAGVAFVSYQDPSGSSVGPHAGLAGGVDLHALPFLSVGVSLRGGGVLTDLLGTGVRVVPTATAGLVLGLHYGFGRS